MTNITVARAIGAQRHGGRHAGRHAGMTGLPMTASEPLIAGAAPPAPASRDLSATLLAAPRRWRGEHPRGFLVVAAVSRTWKRS